MSDIKEEVKDEAQAATTAEAAPDQKEAKPAENTEGEAKEASADGSATKAPADVKLNGLFATKLGMSSVFTEEGKQIPVTVLKLDQWVVTQIKTPEKDGYSAVQISTLKASERNGKKAEQGHLKKSGNKNTVAMSKEIRQEVPAETSVGMAVSWESLQKGDRVRLTGVSKGRGFAGVLKRWNFGGGPAAHGSTFHRQPGSIGNRTWPGRIMPGKKLPGHFGDETVTVKNVEVVDVQTDNGLLLVKGPVPGARNGFVQLLKQ